MSLQSQLNQLASSFTHAVIEAIREVSLEELVAETGGLRGMPASRVWAASAQRRGRPVRRGAGRGMARGTAREVARETAREDRGIRPSRRPSSRRLKRRSAADIDKSLGAIVSLVGKRPRGLRAEEIRAALGMQAKEMPRILGEGLATRKLRKRGHKRATTYFAA